jgi:hypothetical protein
MNDSWNDNFWPSHFSATGGAVGVAVADGDGDEPPAQAATTRAMAGRTAAHFRFTVTLLL